MIVVERYIKARPETVFTFFTDPDRWLLWQGVAGQVEARPGEVVAWHCLGGPPEWIGTDVRWTLSGAGDGTLVVFDHIGFAEAGPMYRTVTLGWAQMLLRLKEYLETSRPVPFFTL